MKSAAAGLAALGAAAAAMGTGALAEECGPELGLQKAVPAVPVGATRSGSPPGGPPGAPPTSAGRGEGAVGERHEKGSPRAGAWRRPGQQRAHGRGRRARVSFERPEAAVVVVRSYRGQNLWDARAHCRIECDWCGQRLHRKGGQLCGAAGAPQLMRGAFVCHPCLAEGGRGEPPLGVLPLAAGAVARASL